MKSKLGYSKSSLKIKVLLPQDNIRFC